MKLIRFKHTKTSVMGVLIGDSGDRYYTLENATTLIPCGDYNVQITYSPKFNRPLPLLLNSKVPASRGVRIHHGNKWEDSRACLLVGNVGNLNNCTISDSVKALEQLVKVCGNSLTIVEEY